MPQAVENYFIQTPLVKPFIAFHATREVFAIHRLKLVNFGFLHDFESFAY